VPSSSRQCTVKLTPYGTFDESADNVTMISHADVSGLWYFRQMRSAIWIGIFIGSTIGRFIPLIWGDDMLSYSGVLLSGIGAFVGLWLGSRYD
jgi:hypothetical protein